MGAMQKLAGLMRRAIEKYDMIQPGDRIAGESAAAKTRLLYW